MSLKYEPYSSTDLREVWLQDNLLSDLDALQGLALLNSFLFILTPWRHVFLALGVGFGREVASPAGGQKPGR